MKITRETYNEVMIPCYKPADLVLESGRKCRLRDTRGRTYLDFGGGIAVNCLGNAPKLVRKALRAQSAKLIHTSNIFTNVATLTLAEKITALTGFDRVFFTNSGAESNEAALKLARRAAYEDFGEQKDEIISFTKSFHGRTFFTVSVGGQDKYSKGFGPRPGAITHLPFNDVKAFEKAISDKTCAVIFEPVQGEGGVLPVDPAFAKRVRELCDKHHALLILDEVQTGCARSGTFFAFEQIGIRPDIVTTAKGLAGGVPIGCVLTTDRIAAHFGPGTHGSTFGGNALACAVGAAVLDKISTPKFLAKVKAKGEFMVEALKRVNDELHVFNDVRGMGLLIGCELVKDLQPRLAEIQKAALEAGLVILTAGGTTIRLAPPLIIKRREIAEGAAILSRVLAQFAAELPEKKAAESAKAPARRAPRKPAAKAAPAAEAASAAKKSSEKPAEKPAEAVKPAQAAPKAAPKAEAPAAQKAAPAAAKAPARRAPRKPAANPAPKASPSAPAVEAPKAPAPAAKAVAAPKAPAPAAKAAPASKALAPTAKAVAAPKAPAPTAKAAAAPKAPAPAATPAAAPKAPVPAAKPAVAPAGAKPAAPVAKN